MLYTAPVQCDYCECDAVFCLATIGATVFFWRTTFGYAPFLILSLDGAARKSGTKIHSLCGCASIVILQKDSSICY